MTVPFAALVALLAALLETTVLPEIPIVGATPDLLLVIAVSATLVLGIEDGLIAAFLAGLLTDMLITARPIGAGTLALLVIVGLAATVARVAGPGRRWLAVALTVVLTPFLHLTLTVVLVLAEGQPFVLDPARVLVAAFMNGLLAIPVGTMFGAIENRFGPPERIGW